MAVAAPTDESTKNVATNHTRPERDVDLCKADTSPLSKLDLRSLENRAYCRFKVCEQKYGDRSGITGNRGVIYRIICIENAHCKQVYLEIAFYNNGAMTPRKEKIPYGCVYSLEDLRNSSTVEGTGSGLVI